ncbi:Tryptophan synthase [Mycena chlorophos]|uniref:tryptophan synthase n=1 Tax=Mycena chlorophos TaxID=658473 RepID=A0A8H6WMJ5_MYCCL|nr:Tryptophan synthase [Mycena chlorophos]
MDALKKVFFADKKAEGVPAFVTFVTAGFPTKDACSRCRPVAPIGMPFSDGPVIQEANTVMCCILAVDLVPFKIAVNNGIDYATEGCEKPGRRSCLGFGFFRHRKLEGLKQSRILQEEKAIQDAAGANGFIMVDLPPQEAIGFRQKCNKANLSYVPLIGPSTTLGRIKFLASIVIYVVSKTSTTGSSDQVQLNAELPHSRPRIRHCPSHSRLRCCEQATF